MYRQPRHIFCAFAILMSFLMVSCSPPTPDIESSKTAQAAPANETPAARAPAAEAPEPAPAVQPKRDETARDRQTAAAKPVTAVRPAAAATPAPATPPAPATTPVPAANSQQSASNSNASAPDTVALPAPQTPIAPPEPPSPAPAPAEPTTKHVTIPAGTEVYVLTIDSIDSETSHPNQNFKASLDKPVVVDNQTVIPRRSDVLLKVTEVEQAGKLKGKSELKVQLDRLFIGKDSYPVASNTFEETGSSEGKKAARNVGIGAAVGGILGGVLGGKTGAVIGAGAGGGGGAVVTKPDQLRINSETQLMFKLENPIDVTLNTSPPSSTASKSDSYGPAKLAPPPDRPSQTSAHDVGDLTGDWTVTADGSQYMTLQLSLRQNGNNLQGSISDPRGSGTLQIRGSINGNYVSFYTQSPYGTNDLQMQFTGAIQGDRGDRMQGNVTLQGYNNNTSVGGYPGGVGFPGGGYPGGGGRRTGAGRNRTTQARWTAQRNN